MASSRNLKAHRAAVFLSACSAILFFWLALPARFSANQSSDYVYYYEPLARRLLAGEGLTFEENEPLATINPPGFTLLLAGVFWLSAQTGLPELSLYSALTLMLMGGAAVWLFQTGLECWGSPKDGWVSALFFISYPFVLWLTKQPATEIPFIFFFYAALRVFQLGLKAEEKTKRLFFLAGALAGLSMLIRASAFGIGALFAALVFPLKQNASPKRKFVFALALLAGNLLAVAPWEMTVYAKTGKWILLGTNGAPSVRDGLTFAVLKEYRRRPGLPPDVIALQETFARNLKDKERLSEIAFVVWEQAKAQPAASLKLALIKALRCWYGTDSGELETPILAVQLFYAASLAFAVWRFRREIGKTPLGWVLAALVLYFWAIAAPALSILRYTVPVIGLFGLILAPAVHALTRK